MARIRTIKPQFFFNEDLAALAPITRLFFIGLWTQVDREGRCEDRPARLKANILPYENEDVNAIIQELADRGHVIRYRVAGARILQVVNFLKHQRPHFKEDASILQPPSAESMNEASMKHPCPIDEPIMNAGREGKGRERKGMDLIAATAAKERTPIQRVVEAYKVAKNVQIDDKGWDKANFGRYSKAAKSLLEKFEGNVEMAAVYLFDRGGHFDTEGLDWTLETIARNAWDGAGMPQGDDHGREHSAVEPAGLVGQGRGRRITSAREIVGDTLRAIEATAVHAKEEGDVDGPGHDETDPG